MDDIIVLKGNKIQQPILWIIVLLTQCA